MNDTTRNSATDTAVEPVVEGVVAALVRADDGALAALGDDGASRNALLAASSSEPVGPWLAAQPRPSLRAGAHPIRVACHAYARQTQWNAATVDLPAQYLEALSGFLDAGLSAWADDVAIHWVQYIMVQGESSTMWPVAESLLDRYSRSTLGPGVLVACADLAARAGRVEIAEELWIDARRHPLVQADSTLRWKTDLWWARSYLQLAGGSFARAAVTYERCRAGFASSNDPDMAMQYLNASLEASFSLTLCGRTDEAIAVLKETVDVVAHEPEFQAWATLCSALPYALNSERAAAVDALGALDNISSDVSSLEFVIIEPARMLLAGIDGDDALLRDVCVRAQRSEQARFLDPEFAIVWRTFAVLAMRRAGIIGSKCAQVVIEELRRLTLDHARRLPAYAALAEAVVSLAVESSIEHSVRARIDAAGIHVPPDSLDPWQYLPASGDDARGDISITPYSSLRFEVLDGLHLRVDGQTFPSQRWEDRRKARNALALMVAAGGRVAREELINGLWDACDIDDAQAAARLSTVLSVVRRALGAGTTRAGSAKRALVLDKTHVELILGADDTTDIADLRAIELAVATCDPREDAQLARHAADMTPMLRGIPLRGCGSGYVVEQRRRELHADLIRISSTIVQRWLVATSADGVSPPHEIRQLAQMLTLNAPLDEAVAHLLMNIFVRAGQTTDASQAYHRYRTELARELGLAPSPDFSRAHAALIVDDPHH